MHVAKPPQDLVHEVLNVLLAELLAGVDHAAGGGVQGGKRGRDLEGSVGQ